MDIIDKANLTAFYRASEAIKKNFTDKGLDRLIEAFSNVYMEDLFKDRVKAKTAIADLPMGFYDNIAESFAHNLNSFPEFWLMHDMRLHFLFSDDMSSYIINKIFENASGTEAEYVYKGYLAYEDESYDLAMVYFNHVDHYLGNFYQGLCYIELQSPANATKNLKLFLSGLNNFYSTCEIPKEEFDPLLNPSLNMFRWDAYRELLFLYNETRQYDLAIQAFEEAIKIHSLETVFNFLKPARGGQNELTEFDSFVNNYLFALEKSGAYQKQVEFLENALDFLIDKSLYTKQLIEVKARIERHRTADDILKKVVRVRRPFNIEAFTKTQAIAREKVLEDMILEQIKYGFEVFGKKLELHQDGTIYGRQYYVRGANGFLDLLLIDKEADELFVVELKRGLAGVEVIEQIEKYMEALSIEMNKPMKGIICLHQANPELTKLVKSKKDIELFTYHFDFKRLG